MGRNFASSENQSRKFGLKLHPLSLKNLDDSLGSLFDCMIKRVKNARHGSLLLNLGKTTKQKLKKRVSNVRFCKISQKRGKVRTKILNFTA